MSLSPAALIVLNRAADRDDKLLEFSRKLPTAARHKMIDALLRDGMIIETKGDYRMGAGSTLFADTAANLLRTTLRITIDGRRTIGRIDADDAAPAAQVAPIADPDTTVAQEAAAVADALDAAPVAPTARGTLRAAAVAVLAAYDANNHICDVEPLAGAIANLRTFLHAATPRAEGTPRAPREGTKQETVLVLLRRDEGATTEQIAGATGWASHTVRAFLVGLKKKGHGVASSKAPEKGAPTVYRIAA